MEKTISQNNLQCEAIRQSCGYFDFSNYSVLTLSGNDRVRFLHNFCTNDIEKLKPGEGCEAFVADIKGHVISLVQIFVLEDSMEILCEQNTIQKLTDHFEKYLITDDVTVEDKTDTLAQVFLTGPKATESLLSTGLLKTALENHTHQIVSLEDTPIYIHRVDLFQQPGYWCSFEKDNQNRVTTWLEKSGFLSGNKECFEYLRIEAGYPIFGIEMTEENLVQEIGRTEIAVSFSKGCYLGQETIARLDSMGHTNRMLCRLTFAEPFSVSKGENIFSGDDSIGRITSVSSMNGTQPTVALGFLKTGYLKTGILKQQTADSKTNAAITTEVGKHPATIKTILDS